MNSLDKDITDYLNDITDNLNAVAKFIKDIEYKDFEKDIKTQYAVIKAIEIIGEASRKLPSDFKIQHPNIPWKSIVGMRDRLVHDYMGIDLITVWNTATKDIPKLKSLINDTF